MITLDFNSSVVLILLNMKLTSSFENLDLVLNGSREDRIIISEISGSFCKKEKIASKINLVSSSLSYSYKSRK